MFIIKNILRATGFEYWSYYGFLARAWKTPVLKLLLITSEIGIQIYSLIIFNIFTEIPPKSGAEQSCILNIICIISYALVCLKENLHLRWLQYNYFLL